MKFWVRISYKKSFFYKIIFFQFIYNIINIVYQYFICSFCSCVYFKVNPFTTWDKGSLNLYFLFHYKAQLYIHY